METPVNENQSHFKPFDREEVILNKNGEGINNNISRIFELRPEDSGTESDFSRYTRLINIVLEAVNGEHSPTLDAKQRAHLLRNLAMEIDRAVTHSLSRTGSDISEAEKIQLRLLASQIHITVSTIESFVLSPNVSLTKSERKKSSGVPSILSKLLRL